MSSVFVVCGIYCISCTVVEFLHWKRSESIAIAKKNDSAVRLARIFLM